MTPVQYKKKEPNREHQCGTGWIPSEGQVRSSHNSRVLERGKLCVLYGILSLWESLWILRSVESKLFPYIHDTWVASKYWLVPSACNDSPVFTLLASWGRQPNEGVSLMKVSALGCPSRLPITSFPTMDIMDLTDVKDTVTLYRRRHLMLSMWNVSLLMVTSSTCFSSTSANEQWHLVFAYPLSKYTF